MKFTLPLFLLFFATYSFGQDLFFEQTNNESNVYGEVDVVLGASNFLRSNIINKDNYDKSEGWELVAIDSDNYYYQITDLNSENYGDIDIWNSSTMTKTSYGNLSTIFSNPENWTLAGADKGILYFSSSSNNSELVAWDNNTIESVGRLSDRFANPSVWKFVGFHDGYMYAEWQAGGNQSSPIRAWQNEQTVPDLSFDNSDYYGDPGYEDVDVVAVSNYVSSTSTEDILSLLQKVNNHIIGVVVGLQTKVAHEAKKLSYTF